MQIQQALLSAALHESIQGDVHRFASGFHVASFITSFTSLSSKTIVVRMSYPLAHVYGAL
jgi:hypothetical protein